MPEDCTECPFHVLYMNKPMCQFTKGFLYFKSREANICPLVEVSFEIGELAEEYEKLEKEFCDAVELIHRIKERVMS